MKQNTKIEIDVCYDLHLQCALQAHVLKAVVLFCGGTSGVEPQKPATGSKPLKARPSPVPVWPLLPGLYHVISCQHLLLWSKTEPPLPAATPSLAEELKCL